MMLKSFLSKKGISRALLVQLKHIPHAILVNGRHEIVLVEIRCGDVVTLRIPDESENPYTKTSETPLDVLFEDEYFLVVNKPSGVPSIPSALHPNDTMTNRVKGYWKKKRSYNHIPHVVTRLDRDTTGVMVFATHALSHAWLDQQLREKQLTKRYRAIVELSDQLKDSGRIEEPIGRTQESIIKRMVDPNGKYALTEYTVERKLAHVAVVSIQLHTGRTHQIRVHFHHIGATLIGDELYGGTHQLTMKRQALHCEEVSFYHPMNQRNVTISAPLPQDMMEFVKQIEEIHEKKE